MITNPATIISLLLASCIAMPGTLDSTALRLDDGEKTIEATFSDVIRRANLGGLVARQSQITCDGSAFCERLGSSCDDAFRKIQPSNTYSSDTG